jgi:hypothetical protein
MFRDNAENPQICHVNIKEKGRRLCQDKYRETKPPKQYKSSFNFSSRVHDPIVIIVCVANKKHSIYRHALKETSLCLKHVYVGFSPKSFGASIASTNLSEQIG